MHFDPFSIGSGDYQKLQILCPVNTYRVVKGAELPLQLPSSLASKVVSAVIVGSGAGVDTVYMVNLHRRDAKAGALDQQPLAIAEHNGRLIAGFIQHGDWTGRTVQPAGDFVAAIEGSGILNYYPYVGMPQKESGDIRELEPDSQRAAFWNSARFVLPPRIET